MTSRQDQDDVALAQEFERLLAVEPSAEFLTRVRARVRHESVRPHGFRFRGWLVLSGAVGAAAYVMVMALAPPATERTTPLAQTVAATATPQSIGAASPSVGRDVGEPPVVRTARPSATHDPRRTIADVTGPEATVPRDPFSDVQVSASEQKALRQLDTLFASGRLQEDDAPRSAERGDVVTELVIAPIVIEPIQLVSIKGEAE